MIEAALCQAIGLPKIEEEFKPETLQAAHTEFRGRLGLHQAIIMAAEANGYARGAQESDPIDGADRIGPD